MVRNMTVENSKTSVHFTIFITQLVVLPMLKAMDGRTFCANCEEAHIEDFGSW